MRKEKKRCQKSQWNPIGKSLLGVSLESPRSLVFIGLRRLQRRMTQKKTSARPLDFGTTQVSSVKSLQRSTVHCIVCIACLRVVSVVGSEFSWDLPRFFIWTYLNLHSHMICTFAHDWIMKHHLPEVSGDVGDWPVGGEIAITTQEYPNMTNATLLHSESLKKVTAWWWLEMFGTMEFYHFPY